ncbi:hypothetical protein PGTUg99_009739 [Puccinia graminis f. sp. tritici]|uniref:Sm domain-containing protein n=1 Tax=Puccinia graminis f. sp. tritici TaxID=56615 RepID=A0A5B0R996_PUCGR|nr:hypothetical protein PGTUg99_009739 [Puccinia graminis f. sp. tritici]
MSVVHPVNPKLANTEEYQNGQSVGSLGEVFIRCNNVLYSTNEPSKCKRKLSCIDLNEDMRYLELQDGPPPYRADGMSNFSSILSVI